MRSLVVMLEVGRISTSDQNAASVQRTAAALFLCCCPSSTAPHSSRDHALQRHPVTALVASFAPPCPTPLASPCLSQSTSVAALPTAPFRSLTCRPHWADRADPH